MNRQQAKELLPIIQAFAEGKTILVQEDIDWCYLSNESDFNLNHSIYCIKPEPKYRPFKDAEECWQEMQKHQPFGWIKGKEDGNYSMVTTVDAAAGEGKKHIDISGDYLCSLDETMSCYTFADGTPFGIKEE